MAGLNCGLASLLALPAVAAGFDAFVAVDDDRARAAVRSLAEAGLDVGETGAAALAGLTALADDHGGAGLLHPDTTVLLLATEGVTDPANFASIVGRPPRLTPIRVALRHPCSPAVAGASANGPVGSGRAGGGSPRREAVERVPARAARAGARAPRWSVGQVGVRWELVGEGAVVGRLAVAGEVEDGGLVGDGVVEVAVGDADLVAEAGALGEDRAGGWMMHDPPRWSIPSSVPALATPTTNVPFW